MGENDHDQQDTRPARAGETDATRFGMEPSAAEEPNATGGGSNAVQATGDADENMIDEDVK